jgi:hypothetical protein
MTHKCPKCDGKGVIKEDGGYTSCPKCLTPERFESSIQKAINKCKRSGDNNRLEDLTSVKSFLPDYPVMAVMEAEARNLNKDFISMLRQSFGVRGFEDRNYLGQRLTAQETDDKIDGTRE